MPDCNITAKTVPMLQKTPKQERLVIPIFASNKVSRVTPRRHVYQRGRDIRAYIHFVNSLSVVSSTLILFRDKSCSRNQVKANQ